MAKSTVDPSNLKSFQRISQEDLRYLKELGEAVASARKNEEAKKVETKRKIIELGLHPKKLFQFLRDQLDKMLYETVPVNEVYASRD